METTDQVTTFRRSPEEMDLHIEREQQLETVRQREAATAETEAATRKALDELTIATAWVVRDLLALDGAVLEETLRGHGQKFRRAWDKAYYVGIVRPHH